MNGSSRFVVTVTDGKLYSCILFTKDTSQKLARECKAFAFDGKVHYRTNRASLRISVLKLLSADEGNEGLRQLMAFLDTIAPNSRFAVCPGDAAGSLLMLGVVAELQRRAGVGPDPLYGEKTRVLANYDFTAVGKVGRKAGPALRRRRRCRYCGKSAPETTFLSKAHTVSEALGNKTIYTNDECDKCNATFASTIDPQFINRLSPFFPC
ncbi:MAG: HNH endonuclease [Alistipes sp.]|nr:HNH endonuclease [Alistipes sp.]